MVGAKIFTFAILVFQASPEVILMRSSVTNSAAIGVVIMTIMMSISQGLMIIIFQKKTSINIFVFINT